MTIVIRRLLFPFLCLALSAPAQEKIDFREETVVFLGDSITQAGEAAAAVEFFFLTRDGTVPPKLINLGLSSETVSGLSEEAHPFPRPNLHERLDRALAATTPDWVVLAYGMNDGIYQPFSEERFAAFQQGLSDAVESCAASGARVILLTPAYFDRQTAAQRGSLGEKTDSDFAFNKVYPKYQEEVLSRYADWVMKHDFGPSVRYRVDIQSPLRTWVETEREKNPAFAYGDSIHPDDSGHLIIAEAFLSGLGFDTASTFESFHSMLSSSGEKRNAWDAMKQRRDLLTFSWLSHVGHQRPKTPVGLPLPEARIKAEELRQMAAGLLAHD